MVTQPSIDLFFIAYVADRVLMLQLFQLLDVTGFDEVNIRGGVVLCLW